MKTFRPKTINIYRNISGHLHYDGFADIIFWGKKNGEILWLW